MQRTMKFLAAVAVVGAIGTYLFLTDTKDRGEEYEASVLTACRKSGNLVATITKKNDTDWIEPTFEVNGQRTQKVRLPGSVDFTASSDRVEWLVNEPLVACAFTATFSDGQQDSRDWRRSGGVYKPGLHKKMKSFHLLLHDPKRAKGRGIEAFR